MPLQATSGAASYDAFGGGVPAVPKYIEDYFSTFLYSGTGASQTITNNIDLSTKGGLVWYKRRTGGTGNNVLVDTARGMTSGSSPLLFSNATDAQSAINNYVIAGTTGYSLGSNATGTDANASGSTYVSWTWAKAPKFFDVVTYTGNGTAGRTVAHNLGSVPGCMIVKRTDALNGWAVYHRSMNASPQDYMMRLNATDSAFTTSPSRWNNTLPTATEFTLSGNDEVNGSGATYVAYLFAHDAGGFGLTGTDNVISCGTFDANLGEVINLGYEPQWLLYKASADVDNWRIADNMRGLTNLSGTNAQTIQQLRPNSTGVEGENSGPVLTSTGFTWNQSGGGVKHIYIAIRRGPMKVPTSGTSVFAPALGTSASTIPTFVTNFPVDLGFYHSRANVADWFLSSRLQGGGTLNTNTTLAEAAPDANYAFDSNTGWGKNFNSDKASSNFRRAPSFFDEVCYTGNGGINNIQNHALASSIGMLIVKRRDSTGNWSVFAQESGGNYSYWNSSGTGTGQGLNGTGAATGTNYSGFNTYLTSASFNAAQIAGSNDINASSATYVAYLFATCAGVSKCFSYTGNGSSQTINCGFTGGARWVMIKRTDSTGDWYVWDSARGIVSGNDPHLSLNTTAAEVTSDDTIDTDSTGFVVNQVSATNVNVSSATYIGLAIA